MSYYQSGFRGNLILTERIALVMLAILCLLYMVATITPHYHTAFIFILKLQTAEYL